MLDSVIQKMTDARPCRSIEASTRVSQGWESEGKAVVDNFFLAIDCMARTRGWAPNHWQLEIDPDPFRVDVRLTPNSTPPFRQASITFKNNVFLVLPEFHASLGKLRRKTGV